MMQISAHARLGRDPRQITTKTGTVMAVCPAAVNVAIAQTEDTETIWFDLVAFGRTAEDLLRHKQGELVNVMGHVVIRRWSDNQNGETRTGWQLICEALLSARTTRPGGGRKRGEASGQQRSERRQQQAAGQFQQPADDFGDRVPF